MEKKKCEFCHIMTVKDDTVKIIDSQWPNIKAEYKEFGVTLSDDFLKMMKKNPKFKDYCELCLRSFIAIDVFANNLADYIPEDKREMFWNLLLYTVDISVKVGKRLGTFAMYNSFRENWRSKYSNKGALVLLEHAMFDMIFDKKTQHIEEEEKDIIVSLRKDKLSMADIGFVLGRSSASVYNTLEKLDRNLLK